MMLVKEKMPENECFRGYTGISLSVWPSMYPSVYKILVILCCELLQFCCYCIESLLIHWLYTEVVEDAVFNHLLPMVEGLSLELANFLLTYYQTTNFRILQTERVCTRQFHIWGKWQKVIQMGRKHCEKRRNCSLRVISPFHTVFSKGLFTRDIKSCHCVGMG